MTISHISDTHGIVSLTELNIPACDVLCITGDWSPLRIQHATPLVYNWIRDEFIPQMEQVLTCGVRHIVLIGGNHDFITEEEGFADWFDTKLAAAGVSDRVHYLCKSSVVIDGAVFYGTPYSDIWGWAWCSNGYYHHYVCPDGTDVLLVHQAPSAGGLGTTFVHGSVRDFGSALLENAVAKNPPRLLLCGHIHGGSHKPHTDANGCVMVNGSVLDEEYTKHYCPQVIQYTAKGGAVKIECAKNTLYK